MQKEQALCLRMSASAVVALLQVFLSFSVSAGAGPSDEKLFLEDQPVVLTVSRLGQPVNEAPAAVTVIDRRMIEASGFRDIPSLLMLVPGFQLVYARGNTPAVTYHGLSSIYPRRMQVLVDGRSIYTTAYGQVLWRTLPLSLEDIDRIEVVRGPNAATDGINAFFATINIITRTAGQVPGTTIKVAAGERSVRDLTLRYSAQSAALDYRVTLEHRKDDRFANLFDDAREMFANARVDYRPTAIDEINLQAGASGGRQEEGDPSRAPYDPVRDIEPKNYFVQVRWRRSFDVDTELSVHAHHTVDDTRADYRLRIPRVRPTFPPGGIDIPFNQNYRLVRSALEIAGTTRPLPDLRLAGAAEIRSDTARSFFYTGLDRKLEATIYRISSAAEYRVRPGWLLHLGAMLEKHYAVNTKISPRVAVSYLPVPDHSFRASVSRGYRAPTFLENYADVKWSFEGALLNQEYRSPGNLRAESITSYELGYMLRKAALRLTLDTRVFYNRVNDIIELVTVRWPVPSPEQFGDGTYRQFGNLFNARQRGVELSARWQVARDSWLVANQTWTRTTSNNPAYASSAPNYDMSILAAHQFPHRILASAGLYRQNDMTWIGAPGNGRVPHHDRLDARVAKRWNIGRTLAEGAVIAQSLLGGYNEYPVDRRFERRYFATLKLSQ
jgi:iron complex outermembrane recepter protein